MVPGTETMVGDKEDMNCQLVLMISILIEGRSWEGLRIYGSTNDWHIVKYKNGLKLIRLRSPYYRTEWAWLTGRPLWWRYRAVTSGCTEWNTHKRPQDIWGVVLHNVSLDWDVYLHSLFKLRNLISIINIVFTSAIKTCIIIIS